MVFHVILTMNLPDSTTSIHQMFCLLYEYNPLFAYLVLNIISVYEQRHTFSYYFKHIPYMCGVEANRDMELLSLGGGINRVVHTYLLYTPKNKWSHIMVIISTYAKSWTRKNVFKYNWWIIWIYYKKVFVYIFQSI